MRYNNIRMTFSIIRHIWKFAQRIYGIKNNDIDYLDNLLIPKKSTTRSEVKTKRENYLEKHDVSAIVKELHNIAATKRVNYMKQSLIMTACIIEFQALNRIRIEELLAIQPDNINFKIKS